MEAPNAELRTELIVFFAFAKWTNNAQVTSDMVFDEYHLVEMGSIIGIYSRGG